MKLVKFTLSIVVFLACASIFASMTSALDTYKPSFNIVGSSIISEAGGTSGLSVSFDNFHYKNTPETVATGSVTVRSTDGQCQVARNASSLLASSVTVQLTADMAQRPVKIEGLFVKAIDDSVDEGTHKCVFEATINTTNPIEYNGSSAIQDIQINDNDKVPAFSDSSVWPATPITEGYYTVSHRIWIQSNSGGIPSGDIRLSLSISGPCNFYNYNFSKTSESTLGDLVGTSVSKTFPAGVVLTSTSFLYEVAVANDNVKNGDRKCTVTSSLTSADPRVNTAPLNKTWTASVIDDDTATTAAPSPTATTANQTPTAQAVPTSQNPSAATEQAQLTSAEPLKAESFLESIKVNDKSAESAKTAIFKATDDIRVSGMAEPNAKLRLYIHSTLRTADITADATGFWDYVIKGLESGSHYIEAEVTKADGTKGTKATIAAFTVAAAPSSIKTTVSKQSISPLLIVSMIIVGIAVAVAVTYIVIRKKKFGFIFKRY